jgi:cardiolipin synthase
MFRLKHIARLSLKHRWIGGNKFTLLENGEAFFPRVFEAIDAAQKEILLETFILFDDKVGRALHEALLKAAARGVTVDLTIDGWGSPGLEGDFMTTLTAAGVRIHVFDPVPGLLRHINLFRRLHRKLLVIDGEVAFIGGINFSADHLRDFGPEAKQDYSVEAHGPIVDQIHEFALAAANKTKEPRRWFRSARTVQSTSPAVGAAQAAFVWRDNHRNTNDIERHYRLAIRLARQRIVIANAYFFPGYAFLRDLRNAAKRGVQVSLILQGNPDMPIVQTAASMLYHHLLSAGVQIYEYCDRPLHGKVAVVDDGWCTVGSSNLDPLSLSLNLEANVMIRDRTFNQCLSESLQKLMDHSCKKIDIATLQESGWWRTLRSFMLFHFLRRYPSWIGWLPAHVPKIKSVQQEKSASELCDMERKTCQ